MIRQATKNDLSKISKMATSIYSASIMQLKEEFLKHLEHPDYSIFIKEVDEKIAGFAECGLRHDCVEGTKTSPIGYFEGVYVSPEHRKNGFAKELLTTCEDWAKNKGCTEFASDCEYCNLNSQAFHKNVGFQEANRIVCYTKKLKNK